MKKTILVTLEYPPHIGGVANYYQQLVAHWPNQDIVVLDNSHDDLLPWLKGFWSIRKNIRKHNIQHILVGQILPLGTVVSILSILYHIPYTVFIHGMDITMPQHYARKRLLLGWILRRASTIITVSQYTQNRIKELVPRASNIIIIPPGPTITPDDLNSNGSIPNFTQWPERFFLSVGRLVERKGFDYTIDAFAQLHARYPTVHYIIAGDGADKTKLTERIKKFHLDKVVHIMSGLTNAQLALLYSRCEFVCMPARVVNGVDFEGFGITVLEGNSFAKPAIGGKNSGMTDAIQDDKTGWLVDGDSVEAIRDVLQRALGDIALTQKLGRYAREQTKKINWAERAKKLM